jgi:2-methylcitrate dehydratase PrpD
VSETAAARLARFAVSTPAVKIGDEVLERAGLHLLDTVGCGLAAVGLDAGGSATRAAAAHRGEPEATVLAGSAAPAPVAALANGTRFHALDFDDTHERGICHVSTVLAAAALAAGQASARSGAETLAAYALGSEVTLRIAVAGAESIYGRGFHPTSAFGVFGATAAAARLLGLPAETATRALGVAGSFAGGLLEFLSDGSDTKPLHAGWAAHAGICAAELAAAGAAGPASVLEGRFGVLAAFGGDAAPEIETADLGERWELERVALKAYPMCHWSHSAVGALEELIAGGLDADAVDAIEATVPSGAVSLVLEPGERKRAPATPYEAKFSLPFCLAETLVHGSVELASFTAARIADPETLRVAGRVEGRAWPAGEEPARFAGAIRVTTGDGTAFDAALDHPPGSPGNPLARGAVLEKFRANAALALAPDQAAKLESALLGLAEVPDLGAALAPLADAAPR